MIILYLLTYLVGEFIFQTDNMREGKKDFSKFKESYLSHLIICSGIYALLMAMLLIGNVINIQEAIITFILLSFFRVAIDCIKTKVKMLLDKKKVNYNTVLYVTGQIFHLLALLFVASLFTYMTYFIEHSKFYNDLQELSMFLIFIIILTKGIGIFIQNFVDDLKIYETGGVDKIGRVIGYLERLIIAFAIISSQYELVLLAFGLKAIYRFKEENPKIDYYITGSLLSLLLTLLVCSPFVIVSYMYI